MPSHTKSKMKGINLKEKNGMWKGDKVSYRSLHQWINFNKPKSRFCECCGKATNKLDASSIDHTYKRDISQWRWLCKKCHKNYDKKDFCKRGHPLSGSNLYLDRKGSRSCRICRSENFQKWLEENKEYRDKYRKEYNLSTKEKQKKYRLDYYKKNKEIIRKKARDKYRKKNGKLL